MKISRFALISLVCPLLLACSGGATPTLEDYVKTIETNDINAFTICAFNDLHISTLTNLNEEFAYYEKCINSNGSLPNLIVLNGDTFMDTRKETVTRFFKWLDALNIPFAYTYGNHDLQGTYSNQFIDKTIKSCQNSVLSNPLYDDVFGDSNYVVKINQGGETKWQLYFFDSNTYHGVDYDIVHDDQIAWYRQEETANPSTPSLSFMHIPTEEFAEVYDLYGEGRTKKSGHLTNGSLWYMGESISWGYQENDLYETMQELGNTKAIIVAHDHVDLTDWYYNKNGNGTIRLIYGMKTGKGIYHDERMMGASFYTLSDSDTFTRKWMFVPYEGASYEMTTQDVCNLWGDYGK